MPEPHPMQGAGAAAQLAHMLELVNDMPPRRRTAVALDLYAIETAAARNGGTGQVALSLAAARQAVQAQAHDHVVAVFEDEDEDRNDLLDILKAHFSQRASHKTSDEALAEGMAMLDQLPPRDRWEVAVQVLRMVRAITQRFGNSDAVKAHGRRIEATILERLDHYRAQVHERGDE